MAIDSIYITDDQFRKVLKQLNVELNEEGQQELIDRAAGALEAELVQRFLVPLQNKGGGQFSAAPPFARNIILTAIKSQIRSLIGVDQNRNVVVEQGQRYIDLHKGEFNALMKCLLDPKREFGFQPQAQADGAITPIQSVGIARADNRPRRVLDHDAI